MWIGEADVRMQGCLNATIDGFELSAGTRQELDEGGFTVIPGPVPAGDLASLAAAYDAAINSAAPDDVKVASSTTRVSDFVNRGPEFDGVYLHPPVLKACCHLFNEPFKLSTMHARTLRPGLPAQDLHVDFERDSHGWTMIGFIFMVDEFRNDNGATRFLPGSHLWSAAPQDLLGDRKANYPGQVLACGPAGAMIVFNGSVWHGHTVNCSGGLCRKRNLGAADTVKRMAESRPALFRGRHFPADFILLCVRWYL